MARKGENLYKRKDGRWEGRFICGRRPDGRARYGYVYGRTYSEAREKLIKKKAENHHERPRCPLTMRDLLLLWLLQRQDIKPSSLERYTALIQRHILPELGDVKISHLTAQLLNDFIRKKLQSGRLDGSGGLSKKTVSDLVAILMSAFKLARRKYAVAEELFSEVHIPAVKQKPIEVFSRRECEIITAMALEDRDLSGAAYLTSLNAGLRLGEICALQWSDFRWEDGTVTIMRTVYRLSTGLALLTPKTEASERTVPLPDALLRLLRELKGSAPDEAFVLTGLVDKPMEPRTLQYRFKAFLKRCGIRHRNYHATRHSFATRCVGCGMDAKTLSELLGHANIKTTLELYVHPSMEEKKAYISAASTLRSCA